MTKSEDEIKMFIHKEIRRLTEKVEKKLQEYNYAEPSKDIHFERDIDVTFSLTGKNKHIFKISAYWFKDSFFESPEYND